ncbi:hypothetical protein BC940DRAFT_306320 [Gongronella butleri]|nr:hypothetical protein BC940DRAFT_306320 [Gongronella butleri]
MVCVCVQHFLCNTFFYHKETKRYLIWGLRLLVPFGHCATPTLTLLADFSICLQRNYANGEYEPREKRKMHKVKVLPAR